MDATRVDRWLCAVRIYKTRGAASEACTGGHVTVNGAPAKPSTLVHMGDRVVAHAAHRDRILEVLRVIDKRVGAPEAATCLIDHTPPPDPRTPDVPVFQRERSTGRPTKRDRRKLDELRRN